MCLAHPGMSGCCFSVEKQFKEMFMKAINLKKKTKGFAMSSELIFLATIVTAGLTIGMVNVRDAVVSEMSDVAQAIGSLDQSFGFDGIVNGQETVRVEGSSYQDQVDVNAGDGLQWTFLAPVGEGASTIANTAATGVDQAGDTGNQPEAPTVP